MLSGWEGQEAHEKFAWSSAWNIANAFLLVIHCLFSPLTFSKQVEDSEKLIIHMAGESPGISDFTTCKYSIVNFGMKILSELIAYRCECKQAT